MKNKRFSGYHAHTEVKGLSMLNETWLDPHTTVIPLMRSREQA